MHYLYAELFVLMLVAFALGSLCAAGLVRLLVRGSAPVDPETPSYASWEAAVEGASETSARGGGGGTRR